MRIQKIIRAVYGRFIPIDPKYLLMIVLLLVFLGVIILDEYNKSICDHTGETRTINKSNCSQLVFMTSNTPVCMEYTSHPVEQICDKGVWKNKK